jgi:hypothetical protein
MRNIKGFAIASDGNAKRIAITYDEVDETGKPINSNKKITRIIMDADILSAVAEIEAYSQPIIDSEK